MGEKDERDQKTKTRVRISTKINRLLRQMASKNEEDTDFMPWQSFFN